MKAVYVLFFLAIAAPLLALFPTGDQDPQTADWSDAVEKAATSRRYGLRLAAARKVAAAGAAAVPAIVAYAEKNGRNALPDAIVSGIAKEDGTDAAVVDLLLEWARDREFYWRPYAFLGLARRANALPERRDELVELFTAHRDDPAWLVASHARLGLILLGDGDDFSRPDDDPRIASKLAALLLENGRQPDLQPLVDALADERTFLGDPWGQRRASEANRALRRALGDAHPGAVEDKAAAIAAIRAAIATKFGQDLAQPEIMTDPDTEYAGGIEVLSCRNGDLFLQWTADGRIYEGLDSRSCVELAGPTWDALSQARAALPLDGNLGVVICDKMRLKWDGPEVHVNVAPAALPEPAADWLLSFAQALTSADKSRLAAAVQAAVDQFASR